jgi:hypothetical protein
MQRTFRCREAASARCKVAQVSRLRIQTRRRWDGRATLFPPMTQPLRTTFLTVQSLPRQAEESIAGWRRQRHGIQRIRTIERGNISQSGPVVGG